MDQKSKLSGFLDGFEDAIPFVFPALGGLAGVVFINMTPKLLLNPMIWIPLGIALGWGLGRAMTALMDRWRP